MKALLIHDADGNITALVTMPPDAPRASVATGPGELASDVELEDVAGEPGTPERHDNLLKVLEDLHVQFERKAKLMPRQAPQEGEY